MWTNLSHPGFCIFRFIDIEYFVHVLKKIFLLFLLLLKLFTKVYKYNEAHVMLRSHIYKFFKNKLLCSLKQCFAIVVVILKRVNGIIQFLQIPVIQWGKYSFRVWWGTKIHTSFLKHGLKLNVTKCCCYFQGELLDKRHPILTSQICSRCTKALEMMSWDKYELRQIFQLILFHDKHQLAAC